MHSTCSFKSIHEKKTPKCFSPGLLFLVLLTKSLSKCPSSTNVHPLPRTISGYTPALRHSFFWKTRHLKCLRMLWMRLCPDNFSVTCTVTLRNVLHQRHSKFWHIQHSVFLGICGHIQSHSALLRHIHA